MATASYAFTPPIQEAKSVSAPKRFYHPELDALRFLAFMLVFCRHIVTGFGLAKAAQSATGSEVHAAVQAATADTVAQHLSPLWLMVQGLAQSFDFGVCLFFFLSSFLITKLLLMEQKSTGTVAIRDFYVRRTLRIWPLYFIFLASVTALSFFVTSIHTPMSRTLATAFFVANWPVVLHGWNGSPIEPLWSVSVEEQFYLIWPNFARLGKKGIVAISLALSLIPFCTLAYLGHRQGTANTEIWPNSLVQCLFFAGGALTAIFGSPEKRKMGFLKRLGFLAGGFVCWLLASGACHVVRTISPGAISLMLGYVLVLAGTFLIFTSFAGMRSSAFPKPILYLGKISYGLYVFHVLFLGLMLKLTLACISQFHIPHASLIMTHTISAVLALGTTILCASLSYRFMEEPFLRLKKRFTVVQSR